MARRGSSPPSSQWLCGWMMDLVLDRIPTKDSVPDWAFGPATSTQDCWGYSIRGSCRLMTRTLDQCKCTKDEFLHRIYGYPQQWKRPCIREDVSPWSFRIIKFQLICVLQQVNYWTQPWLRSQYAPKLNWLRQQTSQTQDTPAPIKGRKEMGNIWASKR